ncbi:MAG: alpha-L-fucosidase [Candidatus Brocadiae bacterium]|nr:alpha-L-fucosidase [Candidatus Brocadiia bacterium]
MGVAITRQIACFAFVGLLALCAADARAGAKETAKDFLTARPEDVQQWRQWRFGLFVHWGPVSLKGTEIGWSRGGERRGRKGRGPIPVEVYDNLYKRFDPVKFDAKQWIAIAQAAGMKYLVFTTKHHDGFSMFDSKLTDYKITNSPFKRDVVKELADACHEAHFGLGFYYSPPDWHHPDYRTANHARYIQYLHGQFGELCARYGKVDIIWFDGLGGKAKDWDSGRLFQMIRQLQPHAIINNRAGLPADFDTPEQRVGRFQADRAWETCMTICRQWAWKPNDRMKPLEQCLQTLVKVVGGDGNFLFNVGPMPDGSIEPRQVERLKEMGAWLRQYGESIYATRGGPFRPGPWGAATCRGNTVYVHLLASTGEAVALPPLPRKIVSTSVLTGGTAKVTQTDESITIAVPKAHRQPIDTIVVLQLDGPAFGIKVSAIRSGSLAAGKKAAASNIYRKMRTYAPEQALDDDPDTRWATDAGTHQAWLEVDLGKPTAIARAVIREAYAGRVRKFELQAKEGEAWRTIARGATLGERRVVEFPPVTARTVRLNILEATEGPTIGEFQLFPPKK